MNLLTNKHSCSCSVASSTKSAVPQTLENFDSCMSSTQFTIIIRIIPSVPRWIKIIVKSDKLDQGLEG